MVRSPALRLPGLAVAALCLLAGGASLAEGRSADTVPTRSAVASSVLTGVVDLAVLPVHRIAELQAGASSVPSRLAHLAAVLGALMGVPAVTFGFATTWRSGQAGPRSRRHSIALRAPPLPSA